MNTCIIVLQCIKMVILMAMYFNSVLNINCIFIDKRSIETIAKCIYVQYL